LPLLVCDSAGANWWCPAVGWGGTLKTNTLERECICLRALRAAQPKLLCSVFDKLSDSARYTAATTRFGRAF